MPQQVASLSAAAINSPEVTTTLTVKAASNNQTSSPPVANHQIIAHDVTPANAASGATPDIPSQIDANGANHNNQATCDQLKSNSLGELSINPKITNNNSITSTTNLNEANNSNANKTTTTTTKLNGLKNRIIQRPPPLILDKVSNFYDTTTDTEPHPPAIPSHSTYQQRHQQQQQQLQQQQQQSHLLPAKSCPDSMHHNSELAINQNRNGIRNNNNICSNNSNSINNNSANQKFWASLNQNASRTRSLIVARNPIEANANSVSAKDLLDSASLGADLIITHRNSSSSSSIGRLPASKIISKESTHRPQREQQQAQEKQVEKSNSLEKLNCDHNANGDVQNIQNRPTHEMSNNSEYDDSSTHGGLPIDNGGGNLIGVDNPTPPPVPFLPRPTDVHDSLQFEDPPVSAISSRPRSTNPFLAMDEEEAEELRNRQNHSQKYQQHNFQLNHPSNFESLNNNQHNRPASFVAATENALANEKRHETSNSPRGRQQMVQEQLGSLQINGCHINHALSQSPQLSSHQQADNLYYNDQSTILVNQPTRAHHQDNRDVSSHERAIILPHQQSAIYGVYGNNYINFDSTISVDSESAVCKPPPSATMQLPHWTEAIYELNNAILEPTSVGGGAENGEFIYIIESGDIVLELDRSKTSGFTLDEFNRLLETKPIHLLKAAQTKHSRGLTADLKYYLNCSFPKNSSDKELQDLIRENIYRTTIPCTTRPPKDGEIDKVDYHFLTKEQFSEMNNRGMLLECGMYGGHYYGTMKPFSDLNSLSVYGTITHKGISEDMSQPLNANHPVLGLASRRDPIIVPTSLDDHPLYENHESLKMHQMQFPPSVPASRRLDNANHDSILLNQNALPQSNHMIMNSDTGASRADREVASDEPLPYGWERVIDPAHGTYYIDHNTQRTQYERPYEIELTKGAMGFGFTLVEADNGVLLVRSVIPGGPAYLNGTIRTGDILISAVGVPVAGLQHTDIAKLFSTFTVGDRVRLTFARSAYVVDANLVPDEYLFSNGTNVDLIAAVNPGNLNYFNPNQSGLASHGSHILVDQEFEFITVTLKRGDQGFGFTISDSLAGQKVRKIQNVETCSNLRQGDVLVSLNGQDITKLTHKEVVDQLKKFPAGQEVTFSVKRKKRFRSKTPMALHTGNEDFSLNNTPQRNCKTPSLDALMLRRSATQNLYSNESASRSLFSHDTRLPPSSVHQQQQQHNNNHHQLSFNDASSVNYLTSRSNQVGQVDSSSNYYTLPSGQLETQSIYGLTPSVAPSDSHYYNQSHIQQMSLPFPRQQMNNLNPNSLGYEPTALPVLDAVGNTINPEPVSLPPMKFSNMDNLNQMNNQYNNLMNNDKLVVQQLQQQQRYQQLVQPPISMQASGYYHVPSYSNSDMLKSEPPPIPVPMKPSLINQYLPSEPLYNSNNFSANTNEDVALQRIQYSHPEDGLYPLPPPKPPHTNQYYNPNQMISQADQDSEDTYEYHQVDLDRVSTDSNWGIRLIGGSEVDRAISIGSIVLGGAASKNGKLKSGDEIISINGINVVGATHQHVVELISTCSTRASLMVRRKKYAEACDVTLTKNAREGYGFVFLSSGNCALIGSILSDSPADRCQQLHVRDRIIAVNGHYITPNMQHAEIVNMIKESGSTLRLRIIPADCYTVELIKNAQNDEFGFTMRGGYEFEGSLLPLYILKVAQNGLARDLLNVGDQIIEINGIPTVGMTHEQAANIIKFSEPIVKLKLRRSHVIPPSLLVDSPRDLQKFNQVTAEMKPVNTNSSQSSFAVSQPTDGGSTSSDFGSSGRQHSSTVEQQQQQHNQQAGSSALSSQSMPLYAK